MLVFHFLFYTYLTRKKFPPPILFIILTLLYQIRKLAEQTKGRKTVFLCCCLVSFFSVSNEFLFLLSFFCSLVSFISDEECCVDRLHARGTREGSHEPVIDAVRVVRVHAGQVPDAVANHKFDHTYHTSEEKRKREKLAQRKFQSI